MHLCRHNLAFSVLALVISLSQNNAQAMFVATTGTTTYEQGGVTVSAQAQITVGNGTIQVVLLNLQSGITTAGQALSGISFTLGNGTASSVVLQNVKGQLVMIGAGGVPTQVLGNLSAGVGETTFSGAGTGGTTLSAARWHVTSASPPSLLAIGGGQPDHMLLGSPGTNGNYGSNLQNQFNPYFQNSITLNLTAAGVTTATTITSATFSFGTSPDGFVTVTNIQNTGNNNTTSAVPAPSTALAALSGLVVFGLVGFARLRRRPQPVLAA